MPVSVPDCPIFEIATIFGREVSITPGFHLQPLEYVQWLAADKGIPYPPEHFAALAAEEALAAFEAAAVPPYSDPPEEGGDPVAWEAGASAAAAAREAVGAAAAAARQLGRLVHRQLCREVAAELLHVLPEQLREYVEAYRGVSDSNGEFVELAGL